MNHIRATIQNRPISIHVITFFSSVATIVVERGLFFYTNDQLDYSGTQNLGIALGIGLLYFGFARLSHRVAKRVGERCLIGYSIVLETVLFMVMFVRPTGPVLVTGVLAIAMVNGLKWPVIESYVSAGLNPKDTSKELGRFNFSWALAVPVALVISGPIIAYWPDGLFLSAAVFDLLGLIFLRNIASRANHLPQDHPERPPPGFLARYGRFRSSSRWSMLSSYALLFLLSPLIPGVFERLGIGVAYATGLSALLDVFRLMAFALMARYHQWHGKAWPMFWVIGLLPGSFFMVLFGPNLFVVILGEILFGIATGISYYAAIYYAMIVGNASINASGEHESFIGLGLFFGPAAGLAGIVLAVPLASPVWGMIAGTGPLILVTAWMAIRPLIKKIK